MLAKCRDYALWCPSSVLINKTSCFGQIWNMKLADNPIRYEVNQRFSRAMTSEGWYWWYQSEAWSQMWVLAHHYFGFLWRTLYLRCPKPSMGVSVRLFGISDLPYSMAGIRIFAEEERNNRIVIMNGMWDLERLNFAGFGILPYQVAISTTPRPFFFSSNYHWFSGD